MKDTKPKLSSIVAAALMGLGSTAFAQGQANPDGQFIPLENLSHADRSIYEQHFRNLEQSVRIDWDSVILGVNEKGQMVLKDRKSLQIQMVAEPSCWTSPF